MTYELLLKEGKIDMRNKQLVLLLLLLLIFLFFIFYFLRSILSGLKFEKSGIYTNMGRVPPLDLVRVKSYISNAGTTQPTVGIMVGAITGCNIIFPAQTGGNTARKIKELTILPLLQDLHLNAIAWAKTLEMSTLNMSFIQGLGLRFQSRWGPPVINDQFSDLFPGKHSFYFILFLVYEYFINTLLILGQLAATINHAGSSSIPSK